MKKIKCGYNTVYYHSSAFIVEKSNTSLGSACSSNCLNRVGPVAEKWKYFKSQFLFRAYKCSPH